MQTKYRQKIAAVFIVLLAFVLGNCSIIFPLIAPFDDLPSPTGPYTVASRTTTWTDSTRDETFTPAPDHRRIVVQVWYPTEDKMTGPPNFYVDDPELRMPALASQLGLPLFLIDHFDKVKANSYPLTSSSKTELTFPIILFSHGLSGMRFQNTSLMEELASQGYVVFAADHSYEANITIFSDGETAEYQGGNRRGILRGASTEHLDFSQLSIVVDDMQFMVDMINGKQSDPFLKNLPFDLDKIGVIGHSLGGAAVISMATEDKRVDAVMVLDGWYIPVPDTVLSSGLNKPFLHLGQKVWQDSNNYLRLDELILNSSVPIFKLLIPGTKHPDYTDMPHFSPFSRYIGFTGVRDPEWLNDLIRENSVQFFNSYLKGADTQELESSIQGVQGASSYIFIPSVKN